MKGFRLPTSFPGKRLLASLLILEFSIASIGAEKGVSSPQSLAPFQWVESAWKSSWSGDGQQLAVARTHKGGIDRVDLRTLERFPVVDEGKDPAWSPDGSWIAFVRGDNTKEEVWLVKPDGTELKRLTEGGFPTWSAGSQKVFVAGRSPHLLKAVELATGASKTLADWTIPSFYPAVSPDGNRVAYGDGNTLIVRDLRTGEEVRRITTTSTNSGCLPGWSADGKYVGFGGFGYAGGALTVLEVATGRHADVFRGPFTMPAWSPDGKRLAFDYRFGSELAIWTVGQSWVEGCLAGTIPTNAISRRKPPVSRAFPRPGFTPPVQTTNLVMKGILVPSLEHLRTNGAFGFPQSKAKILCDLPELRFSVTSNDKYLLAQAILWKDDNSTLGKTQDGRSVGDHSILMMNLGTNGVVTPNVDRIYSLNPWPELPGLHYQVLVRERAWTTLKSDSQGRGAIRQASIPNGRNVRVDTYVIPLTEISKQTGESIRLCYYGDSPAPKFSVDSAGFFEKTKDYYSHHIPRSAYHEYVLEKGLVPDISKFPEGRITGNKVAPTPNPKLNVKVGDTVDMEFTALDGRAIRLSQLKGKVVLVDFWATWCGPCMAELPKVLAAYQKLHDLGFEIIGISFDEDKAALERVLQQKGITWPQYFDGKFWKNEFGVKYGIDAIPSMWLIDRDGKVASTNARQDLVQQVEKLINSKPE